MCCLLGVDCPILAGSLLRLVCCRCGRPQPCCAPAEPGEVEVEAADAAKHI
jgi:hypothetical protein